MKLLRGVGSRLEIAVRDLSSIDWPAQAPGGEEYRVRPVGRSAALRLPSGCAVPVDDRQARMLRLTATAVLLHFAALPVALVLVGGAQIVLASGQSSEYVGVAAAMFFIGAGMVLWYPILSLTFRRRGMPYIKGDRLVLPLADSLLAGELTRRYPDIVKLAW